MIYAFILQTTFFVAILGLGHLQCHAFLPPSTKVLTASASSHTFKYTNGQPKVAVRNSPNGNDLNDIYDGTWDKEASQAILNGQGDFLSFRSLRRGNGTNNRKSSNYLSALSPYNALQSIKEGFKQRISADPEFISKSILEVIIAATTQSMAEVSRRGRHRILPEIDFVFAGVLTAVLGKYYASWRVAMTRVDENADEANEKESSGDDAPGTSNWRDKVPTNAFQPTLLDGCTTPTFSARCLAFIVPMPQLFQAGVIAATIGFGFTSFLIRLRAMLVPQYVAATKPIAVPLVAIYQGFFMAIVSNIRYQLLQGLIEPYMIDGVFSKIEALIGNERNAAGSIPRRVKYLRQLKKLVIVLDRYASGLIGSWCAIWGMQACGLMKLK